MTRSANPQSVPPQRVHDQNRANGHKAPRKGRKRVVRIPRKADNGKRPPRKSGVIGKSVVHTWKDGSGEMRVGKTVVDLLLNPDQVAEWTDEELIRGAPMHISRVPHVIPLVVHQELARRMIASVQHRFAAELTTAVGVHMRMIRDKRTPPAVRLQAIKELYERTMGRAPEHVVLHDGDAPWKQLVANAIVSTEEQVETARPALGDGEVVDGELLEDD